MAKVYKDFQEMYAHLRGRVEVIEPKEYVPKEKPKEEPKPKRGRKKDVLQTD